MTKGGKRNKSVVLLICRTYLITSRGLRQIEHIAYVTGANSEPVEATWFRCETKS